MEDKFSHKAHAWDSESKIAMTAKFVDELKKLTPLSKEMKMIEIGTGTGLVGLQIAPLVSSALLIDTSAAMLGILEQKLEQNPMANVAFKHAQLEDITEKGFDLAVAYMSWHHIEDEESAFASVYALLKKGGKLIIGDLCAEDGSFHGGEEVPHLGFDTKELSAFAETYGLTVQQVYRYSELVKEYQPGKTMHYPQFILMAAKR